MITLPITIEEMQERVLSLPRLVPCCGGSKPALSAPSDGAEVLDLALLSGMVEYQPQEFTFTALAGTPLAKVNRLLAEHGQYLPFDPPLVERGASLGGTVAAGLSGPGRYHYGGVRDFILGVRFINGKGELLRGGGKVVKNAAGFDFPKLMVGSLGRLGVLVELSFKVFPLPESSATLRVDFSEFEHAGEAMTRLLTTALEIDSLDLEPPSPGGHSSALWVRLRGLERVLPERMARLQRMLGGEIINGPAEQALWSAAREFEWAPAGWALVKVPLTPGRIPAFEAALAGHPNLRRYSCGGQVAWLATPEAPEDQDELLASQGLAGLVLSGPPGKIRLGMRGGEEFARRVKAVLDPVQRFLEV